MSKVQVLTEMTEGFALFGLQESQGIKAKNRPCFLELAGGG